MDVWTKGQVTLLKKVEPAHITTGGTRANGRPWQFLRSIKWQNNGNTYNGVLSHDEFDVDKLFPTITVSINNKKQIERFLPDVYHLPHTHNLEHNSYSKGQPKWGAHLADDLLQKIEKHGASNIAAVIVEPVAGSTGVLIPPVGYLEKLRKICTDNEILLIFDEVITGFGRLGKPFAADFFNIEPDLMAIAKGLTSGTVPMAATFVSDKIYKTFMNGDPKIIDFFHGYTYSAHPLACAAAIASLAVYQKDNLLNRVAEIATYWEDALHSLKGTKHIIDIRNLGLIGASID